MNSQGSTSNAFGFVGRYGVMDDGEGLFFMRARFYDAKVGRFLSDDPIGFNSGDWNLYAYVSNNPLSLVDPLGFQAKLQPIRHGPYNTHADTGSKIFMEWRTRAHKSTRYLKVFVDFFVPTDWSFNEVAIWIGTCKMPLQSQVGFAYLKLVLADKQAENIKAEEAASTEFDRVRGSDKGRRLLRDLGEAHEKGGFINEYGLFTTEVDVKYRIEQFLLFGQ